MIRKIWTWLKIAGNALVEGSKHHPPDDWEIG